MFLYQALLIAWTNFVFFLPGLNYKYPADNIRQGLNAHMQFIASDATLQIGIGDTRGLPASFIVTHSPAMFACDACGKVYRYYRNLQSHIRQECGKEPRILCPFCPYRTKIKSNLKKHIQIKHPVTATQIVIWKDQGKTDEVVISWGLYSGNTIHRQSTMYCLSGWGWGSTDLGNEPFYLSAFWVRYEVLTAWNWYIMIFWNLMPCGLLDKCWCNGGTYCLQVLGRRMRHACKFWVGEWDREEDGGSRFFQNIGTLGPCYLWSVIYNKNAS